MDSPALYFFNKVVIAFQYAKAGRTGKASLSEFWHISPTQKEFYITPEAGKAPHAFDSGRATPPGWQGPGLASLKKSACETCGIDLGRLDRSYA
jgi:hypothetical protein